MNSEITEKHINDFIISLYFDLSKGFEMAAIKRAYRDFNRTLQDFPSDEILRKEFRKNWIEVIRDSIDELINHRFESQEEFTLWHQSTCYKLIKANNFKLSQGQTQKWLNMTLKYLFVFGDDRVCGITQNYKFFHIPIDNIIMEKLEKFGIPKFDIPWSKIQDYDSYYKYQKTVRAEFPDRIPMDVEFELFNSRYKDTTSLL